jgi:hypothetical protein
MPAKGTFPWHSITLSKNKPSGLDFAEPAYLGPELSLRILGVQK